MNTRRILLMVAALALIASACSDSGTTATTGDPSTTQAGAPTNSEDRSDWPEKIVFGFIPSEQQEELRTNIEPLMQELTDTLGIEVEGLVTADYTGLVVALGTGQADLGAFGPFGYIQAADQYNNIEVIIQSIRFGSDLYHGQWFTNDPSICDSPPTVGALENEGGSPVLKDPADVAALQVGWQFGDAGLEPETLDDGTVVDPGLACTASLESVRGKRVAFTSSTSTSGAVFPQLQLLNAGIDIERDIEFEYVGGHDTAVEAVYSGDFDIGVSFDDARRNIREENPDVGSKVIVFNITDDIPNDVVAINGNLPDSLKEAIFVAIQDYLATDEGQAALDEIYGWTDIRKADDADFAIVREAAEKLGVTED